MATPQDARARRRQKARRAKKNAEWLAKRAQENESQSAPRTPPKTAT
jgi:hypothetical protein